MYLALLKLFRIILEAFDWIRFHALRYYVNPVFQSGSGNVGERAAKLPLRNWRYPITIVFALCEAVIRAIWQIFKWLFFFNTKSVFEFFLSGVKVVLVLSLLSVVGLYGYLSGQPNPETLAYYKSLHQQHTATALLGRDSNIIGVIINPLSTVAHRSYGRLYVEMVPPVYWDVLDYQTGRQLEFDYQQTQLIDVITLKQTHYKGVSLTYFLDLINPFSKIDRPSLIDQLADNLNRYQSNSSDHCPKYLNWLCRARSSIHFAKHTFPYLSQNKGAEFKRWTAIHGSLSGFKGDIGGLRAAAEVVFNKKPEQLDNGEQALLAMAQLVNVPLLDNEKLAQLKTKAVEVSRELYARDNPALATNIEQGIQSWSLADKAGAKASRLSTRSELNLDRFTDLVKKQLAISYQAGGNQRIISDVQVTLPVRENDLFKQDLLRNFQRVTASCRDCGLQNTLGKRVAEEGANIEIAVANQDGQIVRYFKRGQQKERAIGSLSALPAAILLASLGNRPNSRFCNQTYRNLPSSVKQFPQGLVNCQTLEKEGHSLNFQQAIQSQQSLPLLYALRNQASEAQLSALYKDFGLIDLRTKSGKATHGQQKAYEMSYGKVQSLPLKQLDVIHQLGEVLYGSSQTKAIVPISQFLVSDLAAGKRYLEFNKTDSEVVLNGKYLRTQNDKATLRQLLRFEIENKAGPLKSLTKIKNVKFLLTKTGQTYTKLGSVRDNWLVAKLLIRGRRYSVVAFLGSPDTNPQAGIAEKLPVAQIFKPIMTAIADSLD